MMIRRSIRRLPGALVALLCVGAANTVAAQQVIAARDSARSETIRTPVKPIARPIADASGARDLWEGPVRGDVTGYAKVLLERSGPPEGASSSMWPVETRWTITSPERGRSFVAELRGVMSDEDGTMHLTGVVTEGYRKGTRVRLDREYGASKSAVLRFLARRRAW